MRRRRRSTTPIAAMEKCGERFKRIALMFYGLAGTDTTPEIQALEREFAPKLTAHRHAHRQDPRLFARVDAHRQGQGDARPDGGATAGAGTLHARLHPRRREARCGGTGAPEGDRRTRFDAVDGVRPERAQGRAGLGADPARTPQISRGSMPRRSRRAKAAAEARGEPIGSAITLSRSLIVPFLEQSTPPRFARDCLSGLARARPNGGDDRQPQDPCRDHGACAPNKRHCSATRPMPTLASNTRWPRQPATVIGLLDEVWKPARAAAHAERDLLQAAAHARTA